MCAYGVGWPEGAVGMAGGTRISLMLAVPSAAAAAGWYERALGATELWNLGGVVGLEIEGAPFFLHEPAGTGFGSPATLGATTVRVCDDSAGRGVLRCPGRVHRPGRGGGG